MSIGRHVRRAWAAKAQLALLTASGEPIHWARHPDVQPPKPAVHPVQYQVALKPTGFYAYAVLGRVIPPIGI